MNSAKLILDIDGKQQSLDLPIISGSEGETALDIRGLRKEPGGIVALDPAYGNTASTTSAITYIDGEEGILL